MLVLVIVCYFLFSRALKVLQDSFYYFDKLMAKVFDKTTYNSIKKRDVEFCFYYEKYYEPSYSLIVFFLSYNCFALGF